MNQNQKDVAEQYSILSPRYKDWFKQPWPQPCIIQGNVINDIIKEHGLDRPCRILDLTCGIGTQSFGAALLGHEVVALDISEGQLDQARAEAKKIEKELNKDMNITWVLGNAEHPQGYVEGTFDVIFSFGNSIPLLGSNDAIRNCVSGCHDLLNDGGMLMISMRDHTDLRAKKPYLIGSGPAQHENRSGVWIETGHWLGDNDDRYKSNIIFVMREPAHEEKLYAFPPLCAITKDEFLSMLVKAGYKEPQFNLHQDNPEFTCPLYTAKK